MSLWAEAILIGAAFGTAGASPALAQRPDPLRFFEGRTESTGTLKILLKQVTRTSSVGHGRIEADGSLVLIQQVNDQGKPPFERRWEIRKIGPRRYTGSMSQAVGPISIDDIDGRYRFRFKIEGNISVEQWIIPLPDAMSARSTTTIRKLGVKAAVGKGLIRKIPGG